VHSRGKSSFRVSAAGAGVGKSQAANRAAAHAAFPEIERLPVAIGNCIAIPGSERNG
jgi:hypothetical protein